ncbi:hypothetical protein BC829DRAFT_52552 [Chytridium lagenaria]|nr:hypothetical protein BC829DRAFT_52552 [Chytridium lagenaria]
MQLSVMTIAAEKIYERRALAKFLLSWKRSFRVLGIMNLVISLRTKLAIRTYFHGWCHRLDRRKTMLKQFENQRLLRLLIVWRDFANDQREYRGLKSQASTLVLSRFFKKWQEQQRSRRSILAFQLIQQKRLKSRAFVHWKDKRMLQKAALLYRKLSLEVGALTKWRQRYEEAKLYQLKLKIFLYWQRYSYLYAKRKHSTKHHTLLVWSLKVKKLYGILWCFLLLFFLT